VPSDPGQQPSEPCFGQTAEYSDRSSGEQFLPALRAEPRVHYSTAFVLVIVRFSLSSRYTERAPVCFCSNAIGRKEGAKLATGGERHDIGTGKGYFVQPTIFRDVDNKMQIAQEEIFGPVLSVIPFTGYDEAIRLANDIPYGLASGVHARDMAKALRAAKEIKAGMVWINTYGRCVERSGNEPVAYR
jgi:Aldehyde dehydrogenase family